MLGAASLKSGTSNSPKRTHSALEDHPEAALPAQKRQRVYVACEICRLRKQKCDSKRPACSTCIASNQQCVYGAGVKKRGLPPGYVRVLETLFGLMFSRIKNSEEAVAALLLDSGVVTRQWALGKSDDGTDGILQRFKKSGVCRNIECLLEGEPRDSSENPYATGPRPSDTALDQLDWGTHAEQGKSSGNDRHRADTTFSATSHESATYEEARGRPVGTTSMPPPDKFQTVGSFPGHQKFSFPKEYRLPLLLDLLTESPAWLRAIAVKKSHATLQLPSNTWTLIDIYFTFTNCWLPIVQRQHILKTAHSYKNGKIKLDLTSSATAAHAALWAIIALASFQARDISMDQTRADHQLLDPERMYDIAHSLIPMDSGHYQLEHIQAAVILSLISCGQGHAIAAWQMIGHATQMGMQLGLSKLSSLRPRGSSSDRSTLDDNGLMAGCFIIDTMVSSWLDKPSHFGHVGVADKSSVDTDRLEEYEPWSNRTSLHGQETNASDDRRGPQYSLTIFNQLVKLTSILHDLHDVTGAARSSTVERASTAWLQLRDWVQDLPGPCQLTTPLTNEQKLEVTPQLLHLHLAYNFIVAQCTSFSDSQQEIESSRMSDKRPDAEDPTVSLLMAFTDIFSSAALPVLFKAFAGISRQSLGSANPRWEQVVTQFGRTWQSEEVMPQLLELPHALQRALRNTNEDFEYFARLMPKPGTTIPEPNTTRIVANVVLPTPAAESNLPPTNQAFSSLGRLEESSPQFQTPHDQYTNMQPGNGYGAIMMPHVMDARSSLGLGSAGLSEDQLYPISPMSIDGTFKRPDQLTPNAYRGYSSNNMGTIQQYQQQVPIPRNTNRGLDDGTGQMQHHTGFDPDLTSMYTVGGTGVDADRSLGVDFDLDQLFNDLAPLDHGVSQPAFMMNLGVSGDLGIDFDNFFARPE